MKYSMKFTHISTVVLTLLSFLFLGCSKQVATYEEATQTIKKSPERENLVKSSWKAAAERSLFVDDGWLKSFNDDKLVQFVNEAQQNNFGLKIVSAQVDRAEAFARLAGSELKPTVGLSGGYLNPANDRLGELYGGGINISWEADVWGRVRSSARAAEEAAEATRSDFEFARQSLAAATANSYFLAITANALHAHAEKIVALLTETLRIVEIKHKVGQVGMKDVHLAKANLATARDASRNSLSSLENANRSLEVLLGRYPGGDIETSTQLAPLPPPVATGIPSELLERRPDLVAAEKRVAAAFYKQESAELLHLPRFSFSAGLGITNLRNAASSLAAGFFAPLYTGGAIEAEVEGATAEQKQAIAAYAQKALIAFKEVEKNLAAEDHLKTREQYMHEVLQENFEAYQLTKKQFDVGKIDFLDVLTVQNKWIQAEIALIEIISRRLLNRVGLHLALGGSFQSKS